MNTTENFCTNIPFAFDSINLPRLGTRSEPVSSDHRLNSEIKFRSLIENGADGIAILSAEGKPLYVSLSIKNILGYDHEESMQLDLFKLVHTDDAYILVNIMQQAMASPGIPVKGPAVRMRHKNDSWRWIDGVITNMLNDPAINGIVDNFRDVTERKQAEDKLVYANRLYSFISQINKTIVHSYDEQTIFKEACKIAFNIGKFKAAWIGMFDNENQTISLIEECGLKSEDLKYFINVPCEGSGSQNRVLCTQTFYVCDDIQNSNELDQWKSLAAKRGYSSCIIIPIRKSGCIAGTFNLYASEIDFFNTEEIALLQEATEDISFSLDVFEKEKLRLLANEKLADSELRLQQANKIAHLGSWELDYATGIATWSDEFLKIFGLPMEEREQTYKTWISFIHPDDLDYVLEVDNKMINGYGDSDYFHRIIRRDGTIRYILSKGRIKLDKEGKAVGLHGVSQDITEVKEAENELRKSEKNLKAIFENTSEGFILADIDGTIKDFNNNSKNIIYLNTGQEIKIGESIYNHVHPSRKHVYKDSIAKVLNGEILKYDYPYTRINGEIKWFDFTVNPVYNNGEVEGISITSADITERKATEKQLSESELFNKNVLASLSAHIAVIDSDGIILSVNKAWDDYAKENGGANYSSVGTNYFDVCKKAIKAGESIAKETLRGLKSVLSKHQQTFELEYPCHSPTEKRWFTLHVSSFGNEGNKIVLSHQEVTERKIAENIAITASVELQKALTEQKRILDSSLDVICTINEEGKFLNVSAASKNAWGYTPEELIGRLFINMVFVDDVEATIKVLDNIVTGIQAPVFENKLLNKDGRLISTLWSINWDDENKLMFCIAKDVTDMKKAEGAIRKSESNLQAIFENTSEGFILTDIKGNIKLFNNQAKNIFYQNSGKEISAGQSIFDFVRESMVETYKGVIPKVLSGEYVQFDVPFERKKGEVKWFVFTISRVINGSLTEGFSITAKDITARKEMEELLKQSESNLKAIIENTDATIFSLDKDLKYITFNQHYYNTIMQLYGVETSVGSYIFDLLRLNAAEQNEWMKVYEKALQGDTVKFEKEFNFNNIYTCISFSVHPIWVNNNVIGLSCFTLDITKAKEAGEQIRSDRNLLRTLIDNVPDTIYFKDRNARKMISNKVDYKLLGSETEEGVLGKTDLELLPKEIASTCYEDDMRILRSGIPLINSEEYFIQNGRPLWILTTKLPFRNEKDEIIGLLGIGRDITEKKIAELNLHKQETMEQNRITKAVVNAQEKERGEIGAELHDNVNQLLAASKLYLNHSLTQPDGKEFVLKSQGYIITAMDEIRKLSHALVGPTQDQTTGLVDSLEELIENLSIVKDLNISFSHSTYIEDKSDVGLKLIIYRIVQEQLNNILKHAKASEVKIELNNVDGDLIICINDNGKGFDTFAKPDGIGLKNIRNRAMIYNGAVTIKSSVGKGCKMEIVFRRTIGDIGLEKE